MADEYQELRNEITKLRKEVRKGFKEFNDWRQSVDVGMKGNSEHDVWGYKQKINYNREQIKTNEEDVETIDKKVNRLIWTSIGAGSATGTAAAIIFNLITGMI